MEVLKQSQFSPYTMAQETAILFAAINGHLMEVETKKTASFVKEFLEYLEVHHGALLEGIGGSGLMGPEAEQELTGAIEDFKQARQVK
jgi:F-type H+-transporting ATPase subunit alpha